MSNVIEMLHEVGFYAVSPEWENEEALSEIVAETKKNNMIVQSLHAPYMKADGLWNKEEVISAPAKNEIIEIIDVCAKYKIPILVMHVWIGFDYYSELGDLYYGVFDEIVEYAEKAGIQLAFENTEGQEFLFALLDRYAENDIVGFCWDSGHEMCYNHSSDLLKLYGDRLIMTHINDNLGVSDPNGKIVWTDDLHLLPFDGIADWDYNIERLIDAKKIDILNLEISRTSKPNRNENDDYRQISLLQYFEEAYKRGCKIADKYSNNS